VPHPAELCFVVRVAAAISAAATDDVTTTTTTTTTVKWACSKQLEIIVNIINNEKLHNFHSLQNIIRATK
jgi:hypothetical protein